MVQFCYESMQAESPLYLLTLGDMGSILTCVWVPFETCLVILNQGIPMRSSLVMSHRMGLCLLRPNKI